MKSNICIEKLMKEDYKFIPSVYSKSFLLDPWEEDWYEIPQFNPDSNWIANIDDKIVGFIISFISKGTPYISVVATDYKYQRKGVATKLIKEAISYWKNEGYEKVFIHVEKERSNALSLYKKLGFEVVGEKEGNLELEFKHGKLDTSKKI